MLFLHACRLTPCMALQEAGQPDINIITEKVAFEVRFSFKLLAYASIDNSGVALSSHEALRQNLQTSILFLWTLIGSQLFHRASRALKIAIACLWAQQSISPHTVPAC